MTFFAYVLAPDVRSGLETFVQVIFILFATVSFICVATYTSKQLRLGRLLPVQGAPPPIVMPPLSGWLFIASVIMLIFLQSALYAIVVLAVVASLVVEGRRGIDAQFGINRLPAVRAMTWSMLIFGAVMIVESPLSEASSWALDVLGLPHPEQTSVDAFRKEGNGLSILVFMIEAVFVFPVIEEFFFRGFLLTFLKNYTSTGLAIVLSAGVFGFAHLNLGAAIPLWFLGIVLGVAYQHTGSLAVPIGIHACFNLATALSVLIERGNPS